MKEKAGSFIGAVNLYNYNVTFLNRISKLIYITFKSNYLSVENADYREDTTPNNIVSVILGLTEPSSSA